ncbi:MAG TPA: PfkB family carbohydrate kinase [Opitutaceae bacterium]|nr:PfkB family carbohydrate kinase [Opitutaceae bacterium]HRJ46274.1 PfkB family carbohydrate kinase [Opitutaceae bacterium]
MHASPHIYTLTGNLLAERTLDYAGWAVGRTQRARRESFHTRGKGVNVSNMLCRLGAPTTSLIFAGGPSGAECKNWLTTRGIPYEAFATSAATRTGTVIWSDTMAETTFLGPDVPPDDQAIQACAAYLDTRPDGQVLALCGSFPGWDRAGFEPLRQALVRWLRRGRIAVDAYGPPLAWLARQPVDFIKINGTEFAAHLPGDSLPERLRTVRAGGPVPCWIVTQGADAVWLIDEAGEPVQFAPPRLAEVSPTGSGDVLFACILHARYGIGRSMPDAVRYAIPFAAANAAHPGVADFELPAP